MALVLKDRVKETTATTGAGTLTLAGAVAGFQSFAAIGNTNTTYYAIADPITGAWEVGLGTYTASGTTLSRDTILASSTGSILTLTSGNKDVFCAYPAEKSVNTDAAGDVNLANAALINAAHIGVGTAVAPDILIRAVGDNGSLSRIAMRGYSGDANGSAIRVTKFRGNTGAPQAPQSGDSLGRFEFAAYATTSADGLAGAYWEGVTTEAWGATAHGTKALLYVTPNTTTTPVVAVTVDQDKSVSLTGALSVTGHTTFEGVTSTGATGTAKLVYSTSPTLITPSLGVASATSLAITGTAGAGFQTFVGQSSNPASPAAGTLLVHSKTLNGFTRLEQDNESATNVVYARDNVFIAENPTGSTIPKGSTVYVSGTVSGAPQVQLARANSSSTLPCVGVALDAIAGGAYGQIMYSGLLTFDTSAFSATDKVWVSTTAAGGLQNTRPSGTTNFVQRMGTILVSGNSSTGLMLVQTAPAVLNMETGTNAATWTGSTVVALVGISGGTF